MGDTAQSQARSRVVAVRLTLAQIDALTGLLAYASAGGHEDVGLEPDDFDRLDAVHERLARARAVAEHEPTEGGK